VSVIDEEVTMTGEDWTDKRMDDFVGRVERFEGDVKDRFDTVDRQFDKVDRRFDRLESKVDATNRTIWAGIFVAAMIKIFFG
jgi:hypothetical protein